MAIPIFLPAEVVEVKGSGPIVVGGSVVAGSLLLVLDLTGGGTVVD